MKIIHFSDLHAGAPPEGWKALLDKRMAGTLNYCIFRRGLFDLTPLAAMAEKILAMAPDAVVCTGDITSTGQPSEFRRILEKLAPLMGHARMPLLFVPGNHDKYVDDPECAAALGDAFSRLNGGSLRLGDLPARIRIKGCELILVDEAVPTAVWSSCGYVSETTDRVVGQWCAAPRTPGTPRILVGHFPLIERHPVARFRKRLWGQRNLAQKLRTGLIDVSLCGHVHEAYSSLDATGRGEICAGSATKHRRFSVIEYRPDSDVFTHHMEVF